MAATGSSGRPEPRVLVNVELAEVVLDPAGSPYSGDAADAPRVVRSEPLYIPERALPFLHAPEAFPRRVGCPSCDHVTEMPGLGSDDELELFWNHLGTHTAHPLARLELWVTAMAGAR